MIFALPRRLPASMLVTLLVLLSRSASGHDKWLEAEPFVATAPTATKLYLVTGEALRTPQQIPLRRRSRLTGFQLLTASGRQDLLPALREDEQPIAIVPAGMLPPGTAVVVLDTGPTDILLGAEKFQAYLLEERLIDILSQRVERREEDAPGRERYSRSLKALIHVGASADPRPAMNVSQPTGQVLEIVPGINPYKLEIGSKLPLRVLFRGQPLTGRAVTLANRFHSDVITRIVRTSEQGQIEVTVDRPGDWLISLVHMERSQEPGVDWRSYWASLSFALPQAATRVKTP